MTDLSTERDSRGMKQRMIQVNSDFFIQELNEENQTMGAYYMTPDEKESWEKAYHQKDRKGMNEVVSRAKEANQNIHGSMFKQSVSQLVHSVHSRLMVNAAMEMGEQGLTVKKYFILLQFYATCLTLDKMMESDLEASAFSHETTISRQRREVTCITFSTCPPCQNYECAGLCGKDCNCWPWVCGDCCYYQGCFEHDLCCFQDFYTIPCLFPVGFTCESYTGC